VAEVIWRSVTAGYELQTSHAATTINASYSFWLDIAGLIFLRIDPLLSFLSLLS
jgi:hypothetical protein